jgi:carboxylate-amine ligase
MPTLREVAAVGALVQCLVHRIDLMIDSDVQVYIPREWTIRQNKWLASRYGLDAKLLVDDEGTRVTARDVITDLLDELHPFATELGCADELADVAGILKVGPSYLRQRAVVTRGGSLVDVVHALVEELATDEPGLP